VDFLGVLETHSSIELIKKEVLDLATQFGTPGY
jgi:hypothetical protein